MIANDRHHSARDSVDQQPACRVHQPHPGTAVLQCSIPANLNPGWDLPQASGKSVTMVGVVRSSPPHAWNVLQFDNSPFSIDQDAQMLRRRSAWFGLALMAAVLLSAGLSRMQLSAGSREIVAFGSARQQPNWFTVMGHVGRPQTYELPTSTPSLVDFIRFAGDLKATASGQIRIVRHGRVSVRVRYSAASTEKLLPGDLVVVDGKAAQGRIFRGRNSDADTGTGPVQIGLIGIRPWPIIMESARERATIRWITRQLGQHESAGQNVKAIVARNFSQTTPDTRLQSGSVLVFDPASVDVSRLPAGLPEPLDASAPAQPPSPTASARPTPPLPLPLSPELDGQATTAETNAPGHTAIPDPATVQPDPDPTLDRNRAEFSMDLLTHPNSVTLEPRTGPSAGRTRVTDSVPSDSNASGGDDNRPRPDSKPDARIAPNAAGPPDNSASAPVEIDESPPAERPFRSFIEKPALIERPGSVPEIRDGDNTTSSDPRRLEPGPIPQPDSLKPMDRAASTSEVIEPSPATTPVGPSLATQGAASASQNRTPVAPSDVAPSDAGVSDVGASVDELSPAVAGTQAVTPATNSSRLIPKIPATWNWTVISVCVFGGLGLLAAAGMIISMARQDTTSRPTPVPQTSRYWLDRIINDELPIDEEQTRLPTDEPLFGRPTRIVRVDEPHAKLPKPHFLKRGGQSGTIPLPTGAPDSPQPEQSDDDNVDSRPTTYTPRRPDTSTTRRPRRSDVPMRPAATAEQTEIAENAAEPAKTARPASSGRTFRIDTAHPEPARTAKPGVPVSNVPHQTKRTPGSRPRSSDVKSSHATRDEGLLDRILFQVDQGGQS